MPLVIDFIPEEEDDRARSRDRQGQPAVQLACGAFMPSRLQPKGMVFTFVDLGPRLITVTHHDSITGPYHRNGQQIADVMNSWRGSEPQAHALIAKYRSNYLLSCPNSSTTTIFNVRDARRAFTPSCSAGRCPSG